MPMTKKEKLAAFSYLNAELQKKLAEKKALARQDWWRKAYYEEPYMADASDDYIAARFVDVFNNINVLTEKGQISPLNPKIDGDFFFSRFTHLLEEQNYRPSVLQSADLKNTFAIKPTFPDPPPGFKILGGRNLSKGPHLIKLGKVEFLRPMFSEGVMRISPASSYIDPSLNNAIRDDELNQHAFLKVGDPGLHIVRTDSQGRQHVTSQYDGNVKINVAAPNDFYVLCLANEYNYRLVDDFDANALIVIHDAEKFKRRVAKQVKAQLGGWNLVSGDINYYDPFFVDPRKLGTGMAKHFRFSYQREFRMVWSGPLSPQTGLLPLSIRIGPMRDFASFFTFAGE